MIDYKKLTEQIDIFTKEHVKQSRYEHCQRVAQMCVMLCQKFGLDEDKGNLLGMAHDMCKDFPAEEMISLAKKDGMQIYDMEMEKPALLHGRAAAVLMQEKFGIDDKELIEAVANHVSGCENMCDYTKILYISDKMEMGRKHVAPEYREEVMKLPLDEMIYKVIYDNYLYIKSAGYTVYPTTEKMIKTMQKKLGVL